MTFRILAFLLLFFTGLHASSQNKADEIVGVWLTSGKKQGKIQIYKSGDRYYGKVVWLKYPTKDNKPLTDIKNPEQTKRNQPIIGLVILNGFKFDGDDEWGDGKIYDPESGKTYSCNISLKDKNTLKVRGYIGAPMFGRTEIWSRSEL